MKTHHNTPYHRTFMAAAQQHQCFCAYPACNLYNPKQAAMLPSTRPPLWAGRPQSIFTEAWFEQQQRCRAARTQQQRQRRHGLPDFSKWTYIDYGSFFQEITAYGFPYTMTTMNNTIPHTAQLDEHNDDMESTH